MIVIVCCQLRREANEVAQDNFCEAKPDNAHCTTTMKEMKDLLLKDLTELGCLHQ
jgi:hypothetical protein